MNLYDYFYNSSKEIHVFSSMFPSKCVITNVSDLWNNFIKITLADKNSVISWHNLLINYIFKTDNPLLLCRLYESGGYKDDSGIRIDEIRRTALTIDGTVRYMFVSNYDAAEMFNIVLKNIDADLTLFTKMLDNKEYKFHYQNKTPIPNKINYLQFKKTSILPYSITSNSIQEESYILSGYPNIGTVRSSVLNQSNRYLAHIIGVKDTPYLLPSGKLVKGSRLKDILPKGNIEDWSNIPNAVRKINTNLSNEDKMIIKAHFLRLFDPLNYFATPSEGSHIVDGTLSLKKNIGEYWEVQKYVEEQYEKIYGKDKLDEFRKYALVPTNEKDKYKKIKDTTGENITFTNIKIAININKEKQNKKENDRTKTRKISKRGEIFQLTKKYIAVKTVRSFSELNTAFPEISSLAVNVRDTTRYFDEIITLLNGDKIRITNQIGDTINFPKNRKYSNLIKKFSDLGIILDLTE